MHKMCLNPISMFYSGGFATSRRSELLRLEIVLFHFIPFLYMSMGVAVQFLASTL